MRSTCAKIAVTRRKIPHKDMATAVGMVDKTHALAYQNAIFLTKEFDVTVT